ncbi:hypothetical protein ACFVXG_33880 [Kitasatospora sp. NPDC058162]
MKVTWSTVQPIGTPPAPPMLLLRSRDADGRPLEAPPTDGTAIMIG